MNETMTEAIARLSNENAHLRARRDELISSNNDYRDRALCAEADARALRGELRRIADITSGVAGPLTGKARCHGAHAIATAALASTAAA
jgi:hypothetical protein